MGLVIELSIKETLYFFGRVYGMSDNNICNRINVLSNVLELPKSDRLVRSLSGGQQRRVSFACAFIHEAELVILDEPTVGIDILLRER